MSIPHPKSGPDFVEAVPLDHVRLVLVESPLFYLEIPTDIIHSLCLKPLKYLVFLGWCILGVEGTLVAHNGNGQLELDGVLEDGGLYYYLTDNGETCTDLSQAVDLEVIKQRTNMTSQTAESRDDFRGALLERDTCCVFTGLESSIGIGMHIIPFNKGSEWFRAIIENRPKYNENVNELRDINDIRNGMFANGNIHLVFDPRKVAVLKTPNHVLATTDIVQCAERLKALPNGVTYPRQMRYTLQWLNKIPDELTASLVAPNNSDAAFKKHTKKPKPSDLLLHYNYGAAAVKQWGHGAEILQNRPNLPRPTVPAPASMGPKRTSNDRSTAIQKRDTARRAHEARAGKATAGDGSQEPVDLEVGQTRWDEDDVMLFFWGNSPAAVERNRKKREEETQYMEQWRQGVV